MDPDYDASMTLKYQKCQQFYRQFQQLLQQLQTQAMNEADLNADPNTDFQAEVRQLQQIAQQTGSALAEWDEDIDEVAVSGQVQSIQIEVNKQLRLLETDAIFLRAARQPTTLQRRKQQIRERLEILLQYCNAILSILSPLEPLPSNDDSASFKGE